MLRNIIITLLLVMTLGVAAQNNKKADRAEWFKEMRQHKHDFLAKEMGLTADQKSRFFQLYDQMSQQAIKLYDDVRAKEKALEKKGSAATDDDYMALAQDMAEVKQRVGAVEMSYFLQFKQVLTPRQLVQLKAAERKFDRMMMRQHAKGHKIGKDKKDNK